MDGAGASWDGDGGIGGAEFLSGHDCDVDVAEDDDDAWRVVAQDCYDVDELYVL